MQISVTEHAVQVIEFSGLRDSSLTSLNVKPDIKTTSWNTKQDTKTTSLNIKPDTKTTSLNVKLDSKTTSSCQTETTSLVYTPEPESETDDSDDSESEPDESEDVPDVPQQEFVASALVGPAASAPVVSANVVTASVTHSDSQLPQVTEDSKKPKDTTSDPNIRLSQPDSEDASSDKQTNPVQQRELPSQAFGDSDKQTNPVQQQELLLQAIGDSEKQTNPGQQRELVLQAIGESDKQTNPGQRQELLSQQIIGDSDKQTNPGQRREQLLLQATGDARLTKAEILPQSSTHRMQQHDEESHSDVSTGFREPLRALFVSDNTGDNRLTIEEIYAEAMRLAAEIRIHRHQLDNQGHAELRRILDFCHEALREKLVINSLAKRADRTDEREDMLA